jgi:hypothetical protein
MDDSIYDEDILAWSEQQASALRSLRSRRDLPNELDLEHVAEEIEDVGRSELNAAQGLIRQIFIHVIKATSTPDVDPVLHWNTEVIGFHHSLVDRISPAMINRIDIEKLWQQARREAASHFKEHGQALALDLPKTCPFGVREILAEDFDLTKAAAKMAERMDSLDKRD